MDMQRIFEDERRGGRTQPRSNSVASIWSETALAREIQYPPPSRFNGSSFSS